MTWLLALVPDLIGWLPHLVGGTGVLGLGLSFFSSLRRYVIPVLLAAIAIAVMGLLWYRGEAATCETRIVQERLDAKTKADEAIARGRDDSEVRENTLRGELDTNRTLADRYREILANAKPPPAGCPVPDSARASSRFLRDLSRQNPAGGP